MCKPKRVFQRMLRSVRIGPDRKRFNVISFCIHDDPKRPNGRPAMFEYLEAKQKEELKVYSPIVNKKATKKLRKLCW